MTTVRQVEHFFYPNVTAPDGFPGTTATATTTDDASLLRRDRVEGIAGANVIPGRVKMVLASLGLHSEFAGERIGKPLLPLTERVLLAIMRSNSEQLCHEVLEDDSFIGPDDGAFERYQLAADGESIEQLVKGPSTTNTPDVVTDPSRQRTTRKRRNLHCIWYVNDTMVYPWPAPLETLHDFILDDGVIAEGESDSGERGGVGAVNVVTVAARCREFSDVHTPAIIAITSKVVVTSTLPMGASQVGDSRLGRGPCATANGTREYIAVCLGVLKQRLHNVIADRAILAQIASDRLPIFR